MASRSATEILEPTNDGSGEEKSESREKGSAKSNWGRLLPLKGATEVILLQSRSVTLGRSEDSKTSLSSGKISKEHCILTHREDGPATLLDKSRNGTLVNDKKIGKDDVVEIHHGDVIALAHPDLVSFVYQNSTAIAAPVATLKRKGIVGAEGAEGAENAGDANAKKGSAPKWEENLSCAVCYDLLYKCVCVLPCMHNFCAHCLSGWRASTAASGNQFGCPACRQPAAYVRANHALRSLVGEFLQAHPEKKLTDAERAQFDKEITFTRAELEGSRQVQSHDSDDDDPSEMDSEVSEDERCRACAAPDNHNYQCPPGAEHNYCHSCHTAFPLQTGDITVECAQCHNKFCNLYWNCASNPHALHKFRDHRPYEGYVNFMDATFLKMTPADFQVFFNYLVSNGITCQGLYRDLLAKLESQELTLDVPMTLDSYICISCARKNAGQLGLKFRLKLTKEEVGDSRPDCHWGRNCRTQHHNQDHARRYNHICQQTRF